MELQSKRLSPLSARMRRDDVGALFGSADCSPRSLSGSPSPRGRTELSERMHGGEGVRGALGGSRSAASLHGPSSERGSPRGSTRFSAGMHAGEGMKAVLRRATSAAELHSAQAESMRGCSPRVSTCFSSRMHGGEGLRQALGFCPGRRGESMPPKFYQRDTSPSPSEDDSAWLSPVGPSPRAAKGRPPPPVGGSPSSPTSRFGGASPSTGRASTPTPSTGRQTAHRSACSGSPSNAVCSVASIGERAVEVSPQQRLRGEGVAVGQRGRGSSGIPWRHLPTYSPTGAMLNTGDRFGAMGSPGRAPSGSPTRGGSAKFPQSPGGETQLAAGSPTRAREQVDGVDDLHPWKAAAFSGKLGVSTGMRELLETEGRPKPTRMVSSPPLSSPGSSPLQVWVETAAKRRQERTEESTPSVGDTAERHWAPRVHKLGVATEFDTKQSCPYLRDDAGDPERPMVPATPHTRVVLAPGTAFGPGKQRQTIEDPHAHVADKRPELRRDWQRHQDMEVARVSATNIAANERALLRRFAVGSPTVRASRVKAAPPPAKVRVKTLVQASLEAPVLLGSSGTQTKPSLSLRPVGSPTASARASIRCIATPPGSGSVTRTSL